MNSAARPQPRRRMATGVSIRSTLILLLLLEAVPHATSLRAQSAAVPLQHPVYFFLEKVVAFLPQRALDLHLVPVSRDQVCEILQEAQAANLAWSRADAALLRQYLAEFTDPEVGAAAPAGAERHALRYEEQGAQLFGDLFGEQRFEVQRHRGGGDNEEISRTRAGGRLRVLLPPRLLLAAEFSNIMERGAPDSSEVLQPGSGTPVVLSGQSAFRETAVGYARLRLPWFELEAGRNQFAWNLSPLTQLTFHRDNQPFDLVRLDARWRKFRFVFAHANLRDAQRKFLAAHRLEVSLGSRLSVAAGEVVIYGDRGAEFEYLNPLMLYHAAEHLLGDKDNNVLTLDFSWFPWRGIKWYGEIFIDDLSLEYPIGTYFGNKLGYLTGFYWAQPLRWRSADLRWEYARIDPFVYTHDRRTNIYAQDGEGLGARIGPNADRVLCHLNFQPHRDVRLATRLSYQRQGRGDLNRPHREEDGTAKGFLRGTLIKTFTLHLEIEEQLRRDVYAGLQFDWNRQQNANFVAGNTLHHRLAAFSLRADF